MNWQNLPAPCEVFIDSSVSLFHPPFSSCTKLRMRMAWRKDLLFIAFLLVLGGAVVAGLARTNRLEQAPDQPSARWDRHGMDDVVARLDAEFAGHWADEQLQAAGAADDLAIARRLSLALAGTVPSLEEIRALEAQPKETRLDWWVSRLLQDRRSADYLAERLARAYVGTENGAFLIFRRRRFVSWLSDQVHENRPYDAIVRQMLAGDGLWTNNPAVNFLTATVSDEQPDPMRLAGRASRALLGQRIDCLQCHDDRLGNVELGELGEPREGMQQDFHQLAAFFCEARLSLVGLQNKKREYEFQYLDAEETVIVPPQVPYRADLVPDSGSRRDQLARWITHKENRPFARATVNRFWALMFGRPLSYPVDDIPLHGPLPPGLELLADDFVAHDFDTHRLIRILAASAPFRRASRADFEITPAHEAQWAVFPLTRLRPEQVAGSVIQASSIKTIDSQAHILFQIARSLQTNEFVERYGDMGDDEFEDRGGTIPQRLLLMNGNLVGERTRENPITNATTHIAMFAGAPAHAVETAYLAVLTRRPNPRELAHFVGLLQTPQSSRRQQVEDLYWVLLNSSEFCWNH